ncbi:MAG: metallophosphoesterase, partial [Halobacteria archaeon]|nr:metallophosphoesterase [Halobacteria archaeon]
YGEADEEYALQVGDLGYYELPRPTYFIAGNNEDFDVIEKMRAGENVGENVHLLASTVAEVGDLRVAGLSGNYAPTKFDMERDELEGERRRHFTRAEVEKAKILGDVDVFLSHEAPHGLLRKGGYDVGCKHVDEILEQLEPRLCLVGHHHEHAESDFGNTRVISLAPVWEAYYVLDTETLELEKRDW